ncbi:fumarylacetoacetate hydrolase family protein [Streptomyces sp. NPDC058108]|uniref:fumarylacetoacetate hydrolase family protein n=1 Tax=Streptomyces sp. NPDC058108 TaxID=3346344 RepID=UPI0036E6D7D3
MGAALGRMRRGGPLGPGARPELEDTHGRRESSMTLARHGTARSEAPSGPRLSADGVVRRHGGTPDMISGDLEQGRGLGPFMVLRPGDVTTTGTPAGAVPGPADAPYLRAGDVLDVETDGLGGRHQTCGEV